MHHFVRKHGVLHAEDVSIEALAKEIGTPFYCYSEATIRRHVQVFRAAFGDLAPLIAYSVKANSNLSVLRIIREEGAGADVVSGGELARALEAGIAPAMIVFSGVGKTEAEMAAALDAGILQFNVESEPELEALNRIALSRNRRAPIAFRINPDIAAGGSAKISTGKAEDKFGVAIAYAREIYMKAAKLDGINITGVDVHIGSQICELGPFEKTFHRIAALIAELRAGGHAISRLDLGGGLGVPYGDPDRNTDPPHPGAYAALVRRIFDPLKIELVLEPGRMIVANAGMLISRVIHVKETDAKRFLIIDAGMNDLIRPALYDAYHSIEPVRSCEGRTGVYDVVGPVCESSDVFARGRVLPTFSAGDLVAFGTAGAYGAMQASQYNSRPLVPEVIVRGDQYAVIRRRPSYDEMVEAERDPDWKAVR